MIASGSYKTFAVAFGLSLGLIHITSQAKGDAISPWAGASATAGTNTQTGATYATNTQTGAIASAPGSWSRSVEYSSYYSPGTGGYFVDAHGDSFASARGREPDVGDSAPSLLWVITHAWIGNPGMISGPALNGGSSDASASWTNDSVHLTVPDSGSMPDMVRLQFSLTFNPMTSVDSKMGNGTVTVQANDMKIVMDGSYNRPPDYSAYGFDTVTTDSYGYMLGKFHLDLPVDHSGTSAAFSLMLKASSPAVASSDSAGIANLVDVLSLTDVTRTDGTSLTADGYGVSFSSGLTLRGQPVPEPSAVALWSLVVVGGAWAGRRRLRRS